MRKTCSSAKTAPTASFTALRRGEVVADRLLDDDAGRRRHQAVAADAGADLVEEVGADGEIEGADLVARRSQERRPARSQPPSPVASAAT